MRRCPLVLSSPTLCTLLTQGATPAGGAMTHVEKMRFQAALQTLRGTCPLSTETESAVDARGVCAEEEGQAAAGTE